MNLHILSPEDSLDGDGYEVWLAAERLPFQGLCVGIGKTRDDAMIDAQHELVQLTRRLSELRWQKTRT